MRILRIVAGIIALNTAVLWSIIGMNLDSAINYPSRGLVAYAVCNGIVCFVTQAISMMVAMDGEGE